MPSGQRSPAAEGDNVGLAFYPFSALAQFLDSLDLPTDDGLSARRTLVDDSTIHLILGCIAVLSHSNADVLPMPTFRSEVCLLRLSLFSFLGEIFPGRLQDSRA